LCSIASAGSVVPPDWQMTSTVSTAARVMKSPKTSHVIPAQVGIHAFAGQTQIRGRRPCARHAGISHKWF
jgi:hypothetical protein